MSTHDDDRPGDDGVTQSGGNPRSRRTKIAAGAVGLAAVLGAGAYLVTAQVTGNNSNTAAEDVGPGQMLGSADSVPDEPSVGAMPSETASASPSPTPTPTPTAKPPAEKVDPKVRKEIDKARAKAAEDGFPVMRPVTPTAGLKADGAVNERVERTSEGSVRITSAKFDLTGQGALLLKGSDGFPAGDAHCTQKVRFSADEDLKERPTMLLCWRTSNSRSVVTMAVASRGRPSADASVAIIDREWAKLG